MDRRVVIVTGASSGIGLAIAERRAEAGDRLVVTGRNAEALAAVADHLGDAVAVPVDAGATDAGQQVVRAAMDAFGQVDVVVANAAYVPVPGPLMEAADGDIDAVWSTNVAGPLRLARAAWEAGMASRGGHVVMIGSLGGQAFQPGMGLYSASKAALHHLTRILAAELGPAVHVNAVAPGLIRTEGSKVAWQAAEAMVRARSPLGRLGEPDDVADVVDFLIGPASSWITGEVITLDGGATVQLARTPARKKETS